MMQCMIGLNKKDEDCSNVEEKVEMCSDSTKVGILDIKTSEILLEDRIESKLSHLLVVDH